MKDIKIPFKLIGGERVDDTPVHKALREALANCLVNTDFYIPRGVVIKKDNDKLVLENPGYIRTGKIQMRRGGESDPRNKGLMKMFNLINIGERAGSGVPDVFRTWDEQGWEEPIIEERYGDAARTCLLLSFAEKQAKKISEKNKRKKQAKKTSEKNQAKKTSENKAVILKYIEQNGISKTKEISQLLKLSEARTRIILRELVSEGKLATNGETKGKVYFLP